MTSSVITGAFLRLDAHQNSDYSAILCLSPIAVFIWQKIKAKTSKTPLDFSIQRKILI